jgi:hypothetical protein
MMKFDHTPGPWGYKRSATGYEYIIGKGDTFRFGFCAIHGCNDEAEANAHLIAAAPEMLKELRKCFKDGMEGYQMREEQAVRIKNILESATGKPIEEILKIKEVE